MLISYTLNYDKIKCFPLHLCPTRHSQSEASTFVLPGTHIILLKDKTNCGLPSRLLFLASSASSTSGLCGGGGAATSLCKWCRCERRPGGGPDDGVAWWTAADISAAPHHDAYPSILTVDPPHSPPHHTNCNQRCTLDNTTASTHHWLKLSDVSPYRVGSLQSGGMVCWQRQVNIRLYFQLRQLIDWNLTRLWRISHVLW